MKSWIILIVLAVAITAVATVAVPFLTSDDSKAGPDFPAASSTAGPTPRAEVEGDLTYKFGVMAQETEGKHGWTFKNTGPGPLELRNLGTDCSCTIAQLGKPTSAESPSTLAIQPGSSEPIELTWNTRKVDGPYRKSARIGTNDPNRPEITLAVEGEVHPAVVTIPPDRSISFQTVNNDEPHTVSAFVTSSDYPDLKVIRAISSNPSLLGVETRAPTPEEAERFKIEKGVAIEVTLKATPILGAFAEEVVLETDHPRQKELHFNVIGKVTGPITVAPERVVLRNATTGKGSGIAELILWARGRSSVQIVVDKKPPGLDVAIEPVPMPAGSKGSKYKMTVKVVPGTAAGPIDDEIVLKTDAPQANEVRVPVDVLVIGGN